MDQGKIGDWSPAELQRFIVTTVLGDPANQKKKELPDPSAAPPGSFLTRLLTGGLGWAGGAQKIMELNGVSPGGTWLFFDPIPQHFRHLLIVHSIQMSDVAQDVAMYMRFNNDGAGNYFYGTGVGGTGATTFAGQGYVGTVVGSSITRTGSGFILIPNYSTPTTATQDSHCWFAGSFDWGATANLNLGGGIWLPTAGKVVNAITLLNLAGGGALGPSVATLYGLS